MDREAVHARFERIKQRALKKAEEKIQRELVALGKIKSARPALAADGPHAGSARVGRRAPIGRLRGRGARAVRAA